MVTEYCGCTRETRGDDQFGNSESECTLVTEGNKIGNRRVACNSNYSRDNSPAAWLSNKK